ncbi:MAG: DMT family transporter [Candidatus Tenebribacter mawsonii]|nr:DMT family transporter [Candidatus Tenebribacter mawsonii]
MSKYKTDLLLLTSAIIWGFGFVAQRAGMQYIGPFTYNAIRFAMGGLFLIPIVLKKKVSVTTSAKVNLKYGIILGSVLFIASSFQQVGLIYTTAGNAGFITGIYVVIVPILGMFIGRKTFKTTWIGAILAVSGLYFLSATENISMNFGNLLVFVSSIIWAVHVLLIDNFAKKVEPIIIACIQFLVTSILCFMVMLFTETSTWTAIYAALIPLVYGGLVSVGIGFTLQIIAQKKAHPTHAAIILSLEAVFAVTGGVLILKETLNLNTIVGCLLMLAGMMISQLWKKNNMTDKEILNK